MFQIFCRWGLRMIPFIYGYLIWWQSSHFNPGSVYNLSNEVSLSVIKAIGIGLELGHLFEFGFMYLFLILAFLSFGRLNKRLESIALTVSILYGLIDEIHQYFVPFRSFSIVDLMKDIVGVLFVWFMIHRAYYKSDSRLGARLRKYQ